MAEEGDFVASRLGTKEHWDTTYEDELATFKSSGDIGDVWFGEDSIQRVVDWVLEAGLDRATATVLDIGCGNGAFLLAMADEGFENLYGIDYSDAAIQLAKAVVADKEVDVTYETVDLLCDQVRQYSTMGRSYSLTHDKGTYDAISLAEDAVAKRTKYIAEVHRLTAPTGNFIITSCNWVEEELVAHFKDYFELEEVLPTPQFSFGGKVGSTVTCAIFKRRT